jgi:prolipoprotein diacylglyceryltransferase
VGPWRARPPGTTHPRRRTRGSGRGSGRAAPLIPPGAVIRLDLDPQLDIVGLAVRWQAVALAAVLAVALAWWAARARPARLDDLVYVVLGVVPGAVVGGRIAYALAWPEAYLADPAAAVDLGRGGLSLSGAVLAGAVSGGYVARLLALPVRQWLGAGARPLLLLLGLGKLASLLGGAGQGVPWNGPWAVALTGPGPWASPDPSLAAHPAQVYEGLWILAGIPLLAVLARRAPGRWGGTAGDPAAAMVLALTWWLAGRAVIAVTWRDPRLLGPLGGEQLVTLAALAGAVLLLLRHTGRPVPAG